MTGQGKGVLGFQGQRQTFYGASYKVSEICFMDSSGKIFWLIGSKVVFGNKLLFTDRAFPYPVVLNYLQLKIIFMPNWHIWG